MTLAKDEGSDPWFHLRRSAVRSDGDASEDDGARHEDEDRRVHRHLFRMPEEGLLVEQWGLGPRRPLANRYEEEAPR